jgi:WD40 repeat protein
VADMECLLRFYDRNGAQLDKWTIQAHQVIDFAITPDGKRIVAATTWKRRAHIQNKLKPSISSRDESISASADQPFGKMDRCIAIINLEDKDIVHFVSDVKATEITSIRLSHDGKRILLSCQPDELQIYAIEPHLHFVRKFVGHIQNHFLIRSGFGAPKDRFILSGSEDGHVYVWQSDSPTPIEVLSGHRDTVNAVAWNPVLSRTLFASCSDDTEM